MGFCEGRIRVLVSFIYVRTKQLIASLFFHSRGGIAPVPSNLVLIRREDDKEERRICAHINV